MLKLSAKKSALFTLVLVFAASCSPDDGPTPDFNYEISPSTKPQAADWGLAPDGQPRTVGAVQGETGGTTDFIQDEVVLVGIEDAKLKDFVTRTGGKILGGDKPLPPPPSGKALPINPAFRTYTVRIDLSKVSLDGFQNDASFGMKASGHFKISSAEAAKLLALVAREKTGGLPIAPNLVFYGQAGGRFLLNANETPAWGAGMDAMNWAENADDRAKTQMRRAWQFMDEREANIPETRRTKLAIIDGGFHLNAEGHPIHCPTITSPCELPWTPWQYDLPRRNPVANRTGDARCSGGGACPWHGFSSALSAAGTLGNGVGGAGSGSQAVLPILLASDLTAGSVNEALQVAVSWGAQVISMSFGASCDNIFCEAYFDLSGVNGTMNDATSRGIVLLAAAGNDTLDVDASKQFPCAYGDVICVGATDTGTQFRIRYSNWGRTRVDMWAPTNIHALMPAADGIAVDLDFASGTSSSTPFLAGVVGMMKQVNPALTVAETLRILQETAWHDSPDAVVTNALNAYRAVTRAANESLPGDPFEPNESRTSARFLSMPASSALQDFGFLTIGSLTDADYYRIQSNVVPDGFTRITFEFDSIPGLSGYIHAGLQMSDGTLLSSCTTASIGTALNTYRVECDWVPPGETILRVSADHPSAYQLRIKRLNLGLIGPDAFEVNDTYATAAPVNSGTYSASLHSTADTDYYLITAPAGTSEAFPYVFEITGIDPSYVRLWSYTSSTLPPTYLGVAGKVSFTTPGTYRVQVGRVYFEGGLNGPRSYGFALQRRYMGPVIDPSLFLPAPIAGFGWLDPNVNTAPQLGRLADAAQYYAFQNVGKFKSIDLWASLVDVDLLDAKGNLVTTAKPKPNPQIPDLISLNCQGLQNNAYYVVRVKRTAGDDGQLSLSYWMQLNNQ